MVLPTPYPFVLLLSDHTDLHTYRAAQGQSNCAALEPGDSIIFTQGHTSKVQRAIYRSGASAQHQQR